MSDSVTPPLRDFYVRAVSHLAQDDIFTECFIFSVAFASGRKDRAGVAAGDGCLVRASSARTKALRVLLPILPLQVWPIALRVEARSYARRW